MEVVHPNKLSIQRFEELRVGAIVALDGPAIEMSRYVYDAAAQLDSLKRQKETAENEASDLRLNAQQILSLIRSLPRKPKLKDYQTLVAIIQETFEVPTEEKREPL